MCHVNVIDTALLSRNGIARRPLHLVRYGNICDEMVVLDHLTPLVPQFFRNGTVATEHQPLCKVVELLALVHRRMDCPSQVQLVQVFQHKQRATLRAAAMQLNSKGISAP